MNHMDVGGVRHGTSSELRQAVKDTSRCVIGIDLAHDNDFTAIAKNVRAEIIHGMNQRNR